MRMYIACIYIREGVYIDRMYICVHICMSHDTYMNDSCHAYGLVLNELCACTLRVYMRVYIACICACTLRVFMRVYIACTYARVHCVYIYPRGRVH